MRATLYMETFDFLSIIHKLKKKTKLRVVIMSMHVINTVLSIDEWKQIMLVLAAHTTKRLIICHLQLK